MTIQISQLAYFRKALLILILLGCTDSALFYTANRSECSARCASNSLPIATEPLFSQAAAKTREGSVIRTISASQDEGSAQQLNSALSLKNSAAESLEPSLLEIRYSDQHHPHQRNQHDRHYSECHRCNAPPAHTRIIRLRRAG